MPNAQLKKGTRELIEVVERIELTKNYNICRVINGCWQLSKGHSLKEKLDLSDIKKAFHQLVASGFTTFDCADIYTGAEEFLGSFVKELKSSEAVQIHTKFVPDISLLSTVDFTFTEKIIDRSLKRLNKESLDLVQFHWWDYSIKRYVEVAHFLKKIQEKGKIRYIGVTNFDATHLKKLVEAGVPVLSCQSQYSLFDRRIEKKLLNYCQNQGIHHFCYGTLAGGLIAEKYLQRDQSGPETRSQIKYLQVREDTLGLTGHQKLLQLLKELAQKHNVGIPQVAIKYILSQKGVAATIIGVRNSNHILSNQKIFDFNLSDKDLLKIKSFLNNYPDLAGEPFQLERVPNSKFRNIMKMNLNKNQE